MKAALAGPHVVSVTLRRDGPRTPWGIRLSGGADLGTPLVITRAQVGSPSEGELRRGDVLRKVGDYDARDLRHEDAQTLFQQAGNSISLVVHRQGGGGGGGGGPAPAAAGAATLSRARTQPLPGLAGPVSPGSPRPPVAGGVATPFALAGTLPARPGTPGGGGGFRMGPPAPPPTAAPRHDLTVSFPPPLPGSGPSVNLPVSFPPPLPGPTADEDINNQPYRTTPLVLPGAKVKKDAPGATESYLRHHPNPMFRAPPSHYDMGAEVMMKQKVADTMLQRVVGDDSAGKQVVHRQFNSPIGLYSEQSIADTIQSQTGATPSRATTLDRRNQVPVSMKKTYVYDPAKSETFKALKESELGDAVQEVTVPVQTKVFSPAKNVQFKKPAPAPQQTYVNSLGNMEERIQQSGSFRRLMNQVLGESEY